jgi:hypothetical protein
MYGGARPGAGRPKGGLAKKIQAAIQAAEAGGAMPREVMLAAMRYHYERALEAPEKERGPYLDAAADIAVRAAPYLHPRLIASSKGDRGQRHRLLVMRPQCRQALPFSIQRLAQPCDIAVTENRENASKRGYSRPSTSLFCDARKRTSAWAIVSRIVVIPRPSKRIKSFCGAKPPQKLGWTNAGRRVGGGWSAMEISPRGGVRWGAGFGLAGGSEEDDRGITVGSDAFQMVGSVIGAKVRAVGWVCDSGSPWRVGARGNKNGRWQRRCVL